METKLLRVTEVAARLHVSDTTIHRWIEQEQFPNAFKIGPAKNSPYLIPEADVVAYEERRPKAKASTQ